MESPIGSKHVVIYRPFGEFCRGFRPDFIIAAFRERNESGIIYVHLAIFLAIERELKRKFDLNKVMTVIIKFQYDKFDDNSIIMSPFGVAGICDETSTESVKLPERFIAFGNAVSFNPVFTNTVETCRIGI